MSYTWSGGSEVVYSDSNKITGLMEGTLIAADTLVEEEPFARLVRAYGAPDMRDTVVMSGGTLWLQNTNTSGASITNLTIYPVASVGASSIKNGAPEMTVVNGATVSGFNAKFLMRNVLANDVTVQNSAWIAFSSGGTLTRLNVYTGGSATVSGAEANAVTLNSAVLSGGGKITTLYMRGNTIANDLTFQEGGSAMISGGPVINDIKFYAGANGVISGAATSQISIEGMVVSGAPVKYTKEVSGKTSTYLSAMTTATVYLRDGVSANNVTVHSGGFILVSGGATVTQLHVSGNSVNSASPDQTMALVNVYDGGYVSGGDATKFARIMISSGGVIEDMVFHTSTHIYALAGGLLSGGTARTVNLEIRNGTVRGTLVDSGGKLNFTRVMNSGLAIDVTVGSKGTALVRSPSRAWSRRPVPRARGRRRPRGTS